MGRCWIGPKKLAIYERIIGEPAFSAYAYGGRWAMVLVKDRELLVNCASGEIQVMARVIDGKVTRVCDCSACKGGPVSIAIRPVVRRNAEDIRIEGRAKLAAARRHRISGILAVATLDP